MSKEPEKTTTGREAGTLEGENIWGEDDVSGDRE